MEQLWCHPASNGLFNYDDSFYDAGIYDGLSVVASLGRHGPSLNENFVRVASELAPTTSPAPAGHPIVPAGWILQMGDEGEMDSMLGDSRSGATVYRANITQTTVPYYTGGWPPDPLSGSPGHTPPTV